MDTSTNENTDASEHIQDWVNQLHDDLQRRIASLRNHIKQTPNPPAEQRELESDNVRLKRKVENLRETISELANDIVRQDSETEQLRTENRALKATADEHSFRSVALFRENRIIKALRAAFEVDAGSEVLVAEVRDVLASAMDRTPSTTEIERLFHRAFGDGVKRGWRPDVWMGLRVKATGTESHLQDIEDRINKVFARTLKQTLTQETCDATQRSHKTGIAERIDDCDSFDERLNALEAKMSSGTEPPAGERDLERKNACFKYQNEDVASLARRVTDIEQNADEYAEDVSAVAKRVSGIEKRLGEESENVRLKRDNAMMSDELNMLNIKLKDLREENAKLWGKVTKAARIAEAASRAQQHNTPAGTKPPVDQRDLSAKELDYDPSLKRDIDGELARDDGDIGR